ncbi:HAMP domain-containing sensor histidine kinase [Conexibacter arvalis]|nr:sensor histidine kinase [Conexibacter arvalis]
MTVLFLAVLVVMLVAIRELRGTDERAAQTARVVVATSRVQGALQALEPVLRDYVRDPSLRNRAVLTRLVATLDRRLTLAEETIDSHPEPGTAAIRRELVDAQRYVHGTARPILALAPSNLPTVGELAVREEAAERTGVRLSQLVDGQRDTLLPRRERTGRLAELAEYVGVVGIVATILLVVGCLLYMRRAVLGPLGRVADTARAIAAGDLNARVGAEHGGTGEVAELAQTFDQMGASLQESRSRLERQNAELENRGAELVDAVRSAREGASVLRAVLDATPDAIALLDSNGVPIVDNPPMRAVRKAFGPRATAIDQHGTLLPLDLGHEAGESRDEITLLGTRRAFARYAAPVHDSHGRLIGRLLVLREVTGEREAERVKEEFFALVSHELRTPLTAILGYVELVLGEHAREDAADEEQIRHLQIVERNAHRLLRLVGDLLFAAQVESGSLLLDPGIVDLPQITREAVEGARPRAEDAGILLSAKIEPVEPCVGDRDRIAQVFDNLISNALKFTPSDGHVEVRLSSDGGQARIEVSDTGVGVPAEEQARLFDRFFRASNATARAVPGVGLGLMIVRAIVAAHGGEIAVSSEVGVGTTFTVRLPLTTSRRPDGRVLAPVAYRDRPPEDGDYSADG